MNVSAKHWLPAVLTLALGATVQAQDPEPAPQGQPQFGAMPMSDDAATPPEGQSQFGVMPMGSQGSDRRLERRLARQGSPDHDRRSSGPGPIIALQVGVPLFVGDDVDRDLVRPGGSFTFQGGVDLGYGVAQLELGFLGIPVDTALGGRDRLTRVHLGFGGRLQIPNESRLIPYLGASFTLQWWNLANAAGCVVCSADSGFRFTPGLGFEAGASIAIADAIGIDLGLRYSLIFQGDAFPDTRHLLEPHIGLRFWL